MSLQTGPTWTKTRTELTYERGHSREQVTLARGFRWRKLLETGDFATIEEIAEAENINSSYVSRVLRMTLLAPEIVEAILAGRQPEGLTMTRAMQPFRLEWTHQVSTFAKASSDIPAR